MILNIPLVLKLLRNFRPQNFSPLQHLGSFPRGRCAGTLPKQAGRGRERTGLVGYIFGWVDVFNLLVVNVGNGWVAGGGGCWDDDITSDYGSFPKIPCVKRTSKLK